MPTSRDAPAPAAIMSSACAKSSYARSGCARPASVPPAPSAGCLLPLPRTPCVGGSVVQYTHMTDATAGPHPASQPQAPAPSVTPPALRVVYFGASGAFSRPPLDALLRAGYDVRAVVVSALVGASRPSATPVTLLPSRPPRAAHGRAIPLLAPATSGSILQLAAAYGIPVLEVSRLADPATLAALAAYQPDAICVACFSRRLPPAILRLPRLGCLNVHPSLLPANRGPDPLFWTFRHGDPQSGVTIHLMDAGFDTGDIVRQQPIPVPDGCSERALESACAQAGGELLVRSLADLASGMARPEAQDELRASAYPWPTPDDYTITPDRSARWAYNFASGLVGRSEPIVVRTDGAAFRVLAPLGFDPDASALAAWTLDGDVLSLRCSPGIFTCRARRL